MQIILLTNRSKPSARVVAMGPRLPLLLGAVLGVVLAAALFQAGSSYGRHDAETLFSIERSLQAEVDGEARAEVAERLRRDVGDQLDALALRLGRLQAHTLRLDALGERLTQMARLDPEEFDFAAPPARGGPEPEAGGTSATLGDLDRALAELQSFLADREEKLLFAEEYLLFRNLDAEALPSGRPVGEGWISSRYGRRNDPINGRGEMHHGVDFAGKAGSDILAVASGVVIFSGKRSGYGNVVEIDHGKGHVTRYAHNKENLVDAGEAVDKGQPIAVLGSSGRATGPHVHFEVLRDGKPVNPMRYIQATR